MAIQSRTIDSRTSLAELRAEYADTVGYDLDGSAVYCRRFIRVCRILIATTPQISKKTAGGAGTELTWSLEQLEKQLTKAESWLRANDSTFAASSATGGGGVVRGAVSSGFRD